MKLCHLEFVAHLMITVFLHLFSLDNGEIKAFPIQSRKPIWNLHSRYHFYLRCQTVLNG